MRIHKVRKELEYFLVLRTLDNGCRRWIEYVGWEIGRDDTGIYITTPIDPAPRYLKDALCFGNLKRLCLYEKDRLNSEIVRNEEPETFQLPTWQEAYRRTHEDINSQYFCTFTEKFKLFNMEIKIDDILGIKPCSDALKNVTEKGLQAFTFFLQKTCEPLIEEVGLMLRDRFRVWRFKNLYNVLSKAEGKISYQNGEIVMVNPRIGYLIAENASIVEDDELQDMWAGLFASSASSDGKDDSNIVFINILRQLTVFQANILKYAFDNSEKVRLDNGLIVGSECCKSIDEIYELFHLYDLNKIDRELDSLRSLGLIVNGICFKDCMVDLSLTSFGIHFVNKCQGCKIEDLQLMSEQECKEQGLNMPQIAPGPKYLILH